MIDFFGKQQIELVKTNLNKKAKNLSQKTLKKIKDKKITLNEISERTGYNTYQVSYFLRNPNKTPFKTVVGVAKAVKEITDDEYRKNEKKYVVHPTKIEPQHTNPFYMSPKNVATLFGVNWDECVTDKSATKFDQLHDIHLKI